MSKKKVVVQKAVLPGREVEGVVHWYVGVLGRSSELGRCLKVWKVQGVVQKAVKDTEVEGVAAVAGPGA